MRSIILILILASTILNAQFEENVYYSLSGTIAGNEVSMTLIRSGNDIWGNYRYERDLKDKIISGKYNYPKLNLNLNSNCYSSTYGIFNLNFSGNDSINGTINILITSNTRTPYVQFKYFAEPFGDELQLESPKINLLFNNSKSFCFHTEGEMYKKSYSNENDDDSESYPIRIINKLNFTTDQNKSHTINFSFREYPNWDKSIYFFPWFVAPILIQLDGEIENYIFIVKGLSNFNDAGKCGAASEHFIIFLQYENDSMINKKPIQYKSCLINGFSGGFIMNGSKFQLATSRVFIDLEEREMFSNIDKEKNFVDLFYNIDHPDIGLYFANEKIAEIYENTRFNFYISE